MKDLSRLVTSELNRRLEADEVAMQRFSRFFGLKGDPFSFSFLPIEKYFPDTYVGVLKECFEALGLEDLAEILAKVKPRALCPALSPEQVEKLQLSDRRTKHYSNMAVVVVNFSKNKDTATMIEKFFKDLNPKNEVHEIQFINLKEKYLVQQNIGRMEHEQEYQIAREKELRHRLEIQLPKLKKRIEEEGQEKSKVPEEGSIQRAAYSRPYGIEPRAKMTASKLESKERFLTEQLQHSRPEIEKFREYIERKTEWIKDIERENSNARSALLTVMDKWIQGQGGSTFIAVFLIGTNHEAKSIFQGSLHESIEEKLTSIPDHGKLVVSPAEWESIGEIPETLHIGLQIPYDLRLVTSFIEIFKKRWTSSDLISMMREFKRTWPHNLQLKDNLSTLPRF